MRHANHVATTMSNNTMGGNPRYAERTVKPSQAGRVGATVAPFVRRAQQHGAVNTMVQPPSQQPMQQMQQMQQQWGQQGMQQQMMPQQQMQMMVQQPQMQQGMQPITKPMQQQQANMMASPQQYGVLGQFGRIF